MKQALSISSRRISWLGLSVTALGLCTFTGAALVPAIAVASDEAPTVDPSPAPISNSQADDLRDLFEVAGRTGLIDLKNTDLTGENTPSNSTQNQADKPVMAALDQAPNCLIIAPLFDGGQGGFAKGLFTELATDWPETAALASTLADLMDPQYDGRALPVNLSRAGECGPSFLAWELLANPGREVSASEASTLTTALNKMDPVLKRQLGVQVAIRAGLAGNRRLTRRIADTLTDSGLHGTDHNRRDPEHVLLDAILILPTDPVGARARLSWLAERDGPEQLIAIDLMRRIEAAPAARTELKRLAESPDVEVRLGAEERLLATAIEDADIQLVAEMVTTTNNLAHDDVSRGRLAERLAEAIETGDALSAVQAMAVVDRLEAKGVVFDPDLETKSIARVKMMVSDVTPQAPVAPAADMPTITAPKTLNGPDLTDYLGTLETDIETFREVLSRG